jgi:hypothetical protein
MARKYYELEDDLDMEGRWYLDGVSDKVGKRFDSRVFTYGKPIEVGPPLRISLDDKDEIAEIVQPLKVSLRRKGKRMDFTYADFDMPVVTTKIGELLGEIAGTEIQRIPVHVGFHNDEYEIINIISCISCIDTKRSEIEWWTEEDERPDKTGKPRMITELVIDPESARNSHIFRPNGWEVIVIVSDVIKVAFEEAKVTGVKFRAV